jgi:hypothetical protein
MYFWKDVLCQEAWGNEYIHLTLTALGNLHRGVIMMAAPEETSRQSGLTEKLNAVQQYTQALQELSSHLDEAKSTPEVLIGVLCLMAYFEVRCEFALFLTIQCGLSDKTSVVQWQFACLYQARKGRLPLSTDPDRVAQLYRLRVRETQTCTSGGLFAFPRSDMPHGFAITGFVITFNTAIF